MTTTADAATYAALFLCVTASWAGVPFIGATAATAAGVAASQGRLSLSIVVVVTALAGETGGLIGYQIGERWGRELLARPGKHQRTRERLMARGESAYARWGRLAVFVTPAIVSGTARMAHRQFIVWNLLASIAFAVAVCASAYGIGRLVTGNSSIFDVSALLVGVAAGVVLAFVVHRHHRRAHEAAAQ
jgi:membrane-associated protein